MKILIVEGKLPNRREMESADFILVRHEDGFIPVKDRWLNALKPIPVSRLGKEIKIRLDMHQTWERNA